VPVVHVVGAPSLAAQAAARVVHHTLGDGDFRHFLRMHEEVTVVQAALTPATACAEIDRVLVEVRNRKLPGYLVVPVDVGEHEVEPPATPLPEPVDPTDPVALAGFTAAAERMIAGARDVTVLADLLVHRMRAVDELQRLVDGGDLPHVTLLWGKSLVDERSTFPRDLRRCRQRRAGTPSGRGRGGADLGRRPVHRSDQRVLQSAPGPRAHDRGWSDVVLGGPAVYAPITLRAALSAVADVVTAHPRPRADPESEGAPELARPADDYTLDQETVWDLVNGVLSPGNIVLADQGTAFYGMATHRLPHGVTFIGQPLWASIGYTLPAALGAGLAHPDRRPVVLIGDGAAQLTVQAIGTILRVGLTPVVIVVNNDGYGVERAIHGPTREYNDIGLWNWTLLPQLFSGPAGEAAFVARASTVGELRSALDGAGQAQDRLALVELVLPRLDIPPLLATLAKAAGAANART